MLKYYLTCNQYKYYEQDIFAFFLMLNLPNPVCTVHLLHISIQTNHISSDQQPHMAHGSLLDSYLTGIVNCDNPFYPSSVQVDIHREKGKQFWKSA